MIEDLYLENFRNYPKNNFNFSDKNIIIGDNGKGKSNILEAIYLLSMTTSWRTDRDNEVITWDQDFTRIISGKKELAIQNSPYFKRFKLDGVGKKTPEIIGLFPVVLFQAEDLNLLTGPPNFRRHYLDYLISQINPVYTKAVIDLVHILKNRNKLLKNINEGLARDEELLFWDQSLDEVRKIIQAERLLLIQYMQERIEGLFEEIVDIKREINFHYLTSPQNNQEPFLTYLKRNRGKEIAAGVSLYGPQREDFILHWGGHLAQSSLSRGQLRSLVVSLKMIELDYILDRKKIKPILLLDDIFSELDLERKKKVIRALGDYQVIMTTTDLGSLKDILKSIKVNIVQL
jgi:DNA replication and repair protein RecF